jgi:hypothetical protein
MAAKERRAVQPSLRPPVVEEYMFRGSYTTEECSICLEEVHLRRTNCNHTFCEDCLVKYVHTWVLNGQRMAQRPLRCPVCSVGLAPFDVPARVRHLMVWRELVKPATAATAAVAAGGGGGGHGTLQPPPFLERTRSEGPVQPPTFLERTRSEGPVQPPPFLERTMSELSLKACVCCCIS